MHVIQYSWFLLISMLSLSSTAALSAPRLERVSVGLAGVQGNSWSRKSAMSRDGRYIVFLSAATNLTMDQVPAGKPQWYLRDRALQTTQLISRDPQGQPMNAPLDSQWRGTANAAISDDGSTILFDSYAALLPADDNARTDVYRWHRQTGLSYIATPDPAGLPSVYRRSALHGMDNTASVILTFCPGNAGGIANSAQSCALHLATGSYQLVTATPTGQPYRSDLLAMTISGNGRYVAFGSGSSELVSPPLPTPTLYHVYVRDLLLEQTRLIDLRQDGMPSMEASFDGGISDDGQRIVYGAQGTSIKPEPEGTQQVFAFDQQDGSYRLISGKNGTPHEFGSGAAQISGNGRYVVYGGFSLEPDYPFTSQFYRFDTVTEQRELLSVNALGVPALPDLGGNLDTSERPMSPVLSYDGSLIAFTSTAVNLVPGDTNAVEDVFLADFRGPVPVAPAIAVPGPSRIPVILMMLALAGVGVLVLRRS